MGMQLKCRVTDAKYYPSQHSIVLALEEWETKRPVKAAQLTSSQFTFRDGMDVDYEMEKTAHLFKTCGKPIYINNDGPDPEPSIIAPDNWTGLL